jgi:prepilin-type N-terminal cleavage/methylation domain-containing protein
VKTLLRNKTTQTGFTLIELLVVIAIIGLLASVVLLSLNSARQKSRDAKRVSDVRQIASAMELYFNDYNGYPPATTNLVPNYIGTWPTYPTPSDTGCSTTAYAFSGTPTSTSYALPFCLGNQTGGYAAGVHTVTQSGVQ